MEMIQKLVVTVLLPIALGKAIASRYATLRVKRDPRIRKETHKYAKKTFLHVFTVLLPIVLGKAIASKHASFRVYKSLPCQKETNTYAVNTSSLYCY